MPPTLKASPEAPHNGDVIVSFPHVPAGPAAAEATADAQQQSSKTNFEDFISGGLEEESKGRALADGDRTCGAQKEGGDL